MKQGLKSILSPIQWVHQRPKANDWRLIVAYWMIALLIIYFQYIQEDVSPFGVFTAMLFNVVLDTTTVYVIVFIILPTFLPSRRNGLMLLVTAIFLFTMAYFYRTGYGWLFSWDPPNWNWRLWMWAFLNHLDSYAFLAILLLGKHSFDLQRKFLTAEKEKRENELRMLKAQVDPHFLFNNLNILDSLIPTDPVLAQQFLRRLSGLYRYLLRHKDEEVVLLEEEWQFVRDYVFLLQQRFGHAYQFTFSPNEVGTVTRFLPPGALQTVVENVVKHNAGHALEPIQVDIRLDKDRVIIQNTVRKKGDDNTKSGVGLANLQARYSLLTDVPVKIEEKEDQYTITLPILNPVSQ